MTRGGLRVYVLATLVGMSVMAYPQTQSNTVAPATVTLDTNSTSELPPSPVEFFNQLLAADREKQEKALADRPPEKRKQILAKIREYHALKPEQRELRLKATQLRWRFGRLITVPATNRPALLARIPEDERKLLEERLAQWDKLSPQAQKELQNSEAALTYMTMPEEQKTNYIVSVSPARREWLEKGVQEWQTMPNDQRERLLERFYQFFQFGNSEKEKILAPLPEPDRQQIEKTLKKFEELPPEQRAACIRSFEKFTSMSVEERQQFLKNADRWKRMSPAERQQWRDLVDTINVLPPTPPGLDIPPGNARTLPIIKLNQGR